MMINMICLSVVHLLETDSPVVVALQQCNTVPLRHPGRAWEQGVVGGGASWFRGGAFRGNRCVCWQGWCHSVAESPGRRLLSILWTEGEKQEEEEEEATSCNHHSCFSPRGGSGVTQEAQQLSRRRRKKRRRKKSRRKKSRRKKRRRRRKRRSFECCCLSRWERDRGNEWEREKARKITFSQSNSFIVFLWLQHQITF